VQPSPVSLIVALSSAEVCGIRWKDWNTKPTSRRRYSAASRSESSPSTLPSKCTLPLSGRLSAAASSSSVVLPEPLGPYSATNSPGRIVNDTPSTAFTVSMAVE
jgi:hypothetical protein